MEQQGLNSHSPALLFHCRIAICTPDMLHVANRRLRVSPCTDAPSEIRRRSMNATPPPRPGARLASAGCLIIFPFLISHITSSVAGSSGRRGRLPKGTRADECILASVKTPSALVNTLSQFYAPRTIKCEDVFLFPHYGSSELENGGRKQLLLRHSPGPSGSLLVASPSWTEAEIGKVE